MSPAREDPVAATLMLCAIVAGALLLLRVFGTGPGHAALVARDLAVMAGSLGSTLLTPLIATTAVVPLFGLRNPAIAPFVPRMLPLFDAACLLVMALSAVAALAALVVLGRVGAPVVWFAAQAGIAWACHRLRLRATAP